MVIPNEIITRIRAETDLIELAREYFELSPAGRNFKAHCTHPGGDKTPSLTFFQDTQQFRCFSCNVGAKTHPEFSASDVFGFIQWIEGLDFPESVEFLAARLGIELPKSEEDPLTAGIYSNLLNRNRSYWDNLQSDPVVQLWYKNRGILPETMDTFRLGAELHEPIYAIQDGVGRTVSFVRRHLSSLPKYQNEPNSEIFKKGDHLYGLFQAKPLIRKHRFCFVVEGYNDAIILIQAGYPAVAIMAGILTEPQANLLAKYTKNVVLFPDGDTPGLENIRQNARLSQRANLETEILFSPGADPDELVLKYGTEFDIFFQQNRQLVFQYVLEKVLSRYRDQVLRLKQTAIQEVGQWVDDIVDPTQRELYVTTILAAFRKEDP